jgi:hypothetical protein
VLASADPMSFAECDAELAKLGRCEAQVRLRIGELLDALFERRGHHDLGFSSIDAYVVERCRRSARWGRETRGLARRLRERGLPAIRRALIAGRLGWCMADLLVRRATPENEASLLGEALGVTVREMQAKLTSSSDDESLEEPLSVSSVHGVSAPELLMVSASRMLVEYLCGARASDEMVVTALLGEAETTLLSLEGLRVEGVELPQLDPDRIEAALKAVREARSRRPTVTGTPCAPSVEVEAMDFGPLPQTAAALDRELVRRCRDLAERNLRIGRLAQMLFTSRTWRTLGYASPEDYARDRVGVSLSSLEHRATLARRTARCPALREALERGEVGYEAALLIGRVMGPTSNAAVAEAWIARAKRRTFKHLRQEVDAIMLSTSLDPRVSREPPTAADLEAIEALERKVQSGAFFRSLLGQQTPVPQMSVTFEAPGSLRPLRLKLPVELHLHWQHVESTFREVAGHKASFVAFACFTLWSTWLPYLEQWEDKWIDVYRRDRCRCRTPVCDRRDGTPHHIVFQGHGGGDETSNVISVCSWCHLHGIHEGRLSVRGDATNAEWTVGADPIIEVRGREVVRA